MGHQKRIRKLVRLISYSSAVHVAVWQECYWRWRSLTEAIFDSDQPEGVENGRNHTPAWHQVRRSLYLNNLFLTQLAGATLSMAESDPLPRCSGRLLYARRSRSHFVNQCHSASVATRRNASHAEPCFACWNLHHRPYQPSGHIGHSDSRCCKRCAWNRVKPQTLLKASQTFGRVCLLDVEKEPSLIILRTIRKIQESADVELTLAYLFLDQVCPSHLNLLPLSQWIAVYCGAEAPG